MPLVLAITQPPMKTTLAMAPEREEDAAGPGQGDGAEAELDGGDDRERDHRLAVLAVHPDGGGVDGAGAERRGADDGEPAERAEGGDGVGGMELLAVLLPFDDDGHGGTPFS